ncbi:BTAD domain-containing putative transcriptional regulator [Lentzea sp. NBRC 105346]|uniref:AfsR/SARP family transcriptional regulator n=1 Tax=Lentzea sp. NBRC 105346 TaxID=3032205 RepID=UPI002556DEA7|nr:BTAD domain-containing putative transcriptional regulator [Lentzea sp. NBRC 105346]
MEIRLLGTVEAFADGRPVRLGPPQQRLVLAVLATHAGRVVPAETLIDRVWDSAPHGARRTLHVYVSRLRHVLPIPRRSGGYVLDVDPEVVDVHRFRRLRDRGDHEEAIELWRGEPLATMPGAWAAAMRAAWEQDYLDAVVAWAAGTPSAAVGKLTELVGAYPLVESLAAELMRALQASGRSCEALRCYERIRRRLADEFGVDPGTALRRAHQAVLAGTVSVVPAQLPADVPGFVGRRRQLAALDAALLTGGTATITGAEGVGKSALAVHWAHGVRGRFPDGQLYADLRETTPAEALRGFLDGAPNASPALFRSTMAGKRALIVLDNVCDAAQVRPLLPGAPGCLVLVTSRDPLLGLVTAGARPVGVGPLTGAEARQLLANRVGAEPYGVEEIVARCGGVPGALAFAAAGVLTRLNAAFE